MTGPVLCVTGLRKRYGPVQALDGVDLEIARGEIVGLLGHNGAGKTTLMSIVAGLRRADEGRVLVDGIDVARSPVRACRRLGLAPQETGLYPSASVRDNLRAFGSLAGLGRRLLRERVEEAATAFGLTDLLDRRTDQLSGGQRRRVHTAAAVLHRPPLLLLDEPTVGADVATRDALLAVVGRLAADGAGVCYSTHYLPEVEVLGASVALIEQGRLLARGSIADLLAAHAVTAVEFTFDGPPPEPPDLPGARVQGSLLHVPSPEPARAAAALLTGLPPGAVARLRSVDLVRGDLESAYRALTGRDANAEQVSAAAVRETARP